MPLHVVLIKWNCFFLQVLFLIVWYTFKSIFRMTKRLLTTLYKKKEAKKYWKSSVISLLFAKIKTADKAFKEGQSNWLGFSRLCYLMHLPCLHDDVPYLRAFGHYLHALITSLAPVLLALYLCDFKCGKISY